MSASVRFFAGVRGKMELPRTHKKNKSGQMEFIAMWKVYALLAALFAALTAIFAKIGIEGVDSNLATGIRTVVILVLMGHRLCNRSAFGHKIAERNKLDIFDSLRHRNGLVVDVLLSCDSTRRRVAGCSH